MACTAAVESKRYLVLIFKKFGKSLFVLVVCAFASLVFHSRIKLDEGNRVPVFSEENFRGVAKWWLYGAPFYLFVIFAPDRFFYDEEEELDD